MTNFVFKTRSFVSKTSKFVSKTRNFEFKMMNFAGSCSGGSTTKQPGGMIGCDGTCFTSKPCPPMLWSPVIMACVMGCMGFTMVLLIAVRK